MRTLSLFLLAAVALADSALDPLRTVIGVLEGITENVGLYTQYSILFLATNESDPDALGLVSYSQARMNTSIIEGITIINETVQLTPLDASAQDQIIAAVQKLRIAIEDEIKLFIDSAEPLMAGDWKTIGPAGLPLQAVLTSRLCRVIGPTQGDWSKLTDECDLVAHAFFVGFEHFSAPTLSKRSLENDDSQSNGELETPSARSESSKIADLIKYIEILEGNIYRFRDCVLDMVDQTFLETNTSLTAVQLSVDYANGWMDELAQYLRNVERFDTADYAEHELSLLNDTLSLLSGAIWQEVTSIRPWTYIKPDADSFTPELRQIVSGGWTQQKVKLEQLWLTWRNRTNIYGDSYFGESWAILSEGIEFFESLNPPPTRMSKRQEVDVADPIALALEAVISSTNAYTLENIKFLNSNYTLDDYPIHEQSALASAVGGLTSYNECYETVSNNIANQTPIQSVWLTGFMQEWIRAVSNQMYFLEGMIPNMLVKNVFKGIEEELLAQRNATVDISSASKDTGNVMVMDWEEASDEVIRLLDEGLGLISKSAAETVEPVI